MISRGTCLLSIHLLDADKAQRRNVNLEVGFNGIKDRDVPWVTPRGPHCLALSPQANGDPYVPAVRQELGCVDLTVAIYSALRIL